MENGSGGFVKVLCSLDSGDGDETYLVCRKITASDRDRLMVDVCIRSIRFNS